MRICWVVKRGNDYSLSVTGSAGTWPGSGYTTDRAWAYRFTATDWELYKP